MRSVTTVVLALLVWLAVPGPASAQQAVDRTCRVAFVIDGDTFNCRDGTSVRLFGVDAPEGGRFGDLSRRALATLLPVDSVVRIERGGEERDSQGRLRGFVYLDDGRMVNAVMIRKGYAFFKPGSPDAPHSEQLRTAERIAKRDEVGVWSY